MSENKRKWAQFFFCKQDNRDDRIEYAYKAAKSYYHKVAEMFTDEGLEVPILAEEVLEVRPYPEKSYHIMTFLTNEEQEKFLCELSNKERV